MLRRYRRAVGPAGEGRLGRLTLAAGAGYFFVWTLLGAAVFPLGAMLAAAQPHLPARAATAATGAALFIAGALQFSRWKAHHLACCREAPGCCVIPAADIPTAWRHGVRLGRHCCRCCAGLTAILLVAGVMDLRVMSAITAASTIERLAPAGEHVARSIGAVVLAAALLLMVHG
jgi:predicted metal-binding membrane protein